MFDKFFFPIFFSYAMYYENLLRHQHQLLYIKEQVRKKPKSLPQFCLVKFNNSELLRNSRIDFTHSRPRFNLKLF